DSSQCALRNNLRPASKTQVQLHKPSFRLESVQNCRVGLGLSLQATQMLPWFRVVPVTPMIGKQTESLARKADFLNAKPTLTRARSPNRYGASLSKDFGLTPK